MRKNQKLSVELLARLCSLDVDQVLLTLWEEGIEDVVDARSVLVGNKLLYAKRILKIPKANQLTTLGYWQAVFSFNEKQLRGLLFDLKIPITEKARKLPKGAIRKLKSEALKRKTSLQAVPTIIIAPTEEPPTNILTWKIIGHEEEHISTINTEEVLKIHYELVDDFLTNYDPIDPPGPRNNDILASAVYRQETSIGAEAKYPTIEMMGAALLHSLIHDHPFHNGNKRTALVSLLVFLDKNQRMLVCRQDELFKFVLNVAQHRIVKEKYIDLADREVMEIAEWIKDNSRGIKMGDRPLPFRKLKQILYKNGCEINHSYGGTNFKITRTRKGKGLFERKRILTTNISSGNEGIDVEVRTIKKIRNELELNEEHGIDSGAFYEDSPTAVDDFILKYRKTLLRLSRV